MNKKYKDLKVKFLEEYKSYVQDLKYAADELEEDLINQKWEQPVSQIKDIGIKLREIKTLETLV